MSKGYADVKDQVGLIEKAAEPRFSPAHQKKATW